MKNGGKNKSVAFIILVSVYTMCINALEMYFSSKLKYTFLYSILQ